MICVAFFFQILPTFYNLLVLIRWAGISELAVIVVYEVNCVLLIYEVTGVLLKRKRNSKKNRFFRIFYVISSLYCILLRRSRRFTKLRSHLYQHAKTELLTLYPKWIVFYWRGSVAWKFFRYIRILTLYPKWTNFCKGLKVSIKLPMLVNCRRKTSRCRAGVLFLQ